MRRLLPNTLYGQLLLGQLLLFGLIIVLLPTILVIDLHRTADDFVARRLGADARTIERALAAPVPPSKQALEHLLGPFYQPGWATRAYRIADAANHPLYQGGVTGDFGVTPLARDGVRTFFHRGNLDVYEISRQIGGRRYRIAIAQDRTRPEVIVDNVVASFLHRAIWLVPIIFLGSTLLGLFFLRRLTATLRHVARDAEHIGPQTLDTRLPVARLPMEARSLVTATNRALDRVAQGYRRQASFVASVAHELRTPLALVALRSDLFPDGADKAALKRAVDQATHVVSQLMELAMIDGRTPSVETIDLDLIARETVETMAPLVYRSGRTIEVLNSFELSSRTIGNDGLLRIALTNLIDNAVRHTPSETRIVVAAMFDAVFVCDDGPGIEVEDGDDITAQYRTTARQRTDSAGLGLSIVQRIMMAMGGRMTVMPNAPGTNIRLDLGIASDGGRMRRSGK
jgi:signal transduction histidine kinase